MNRFIILVLLMMPILLIGITRNVALDGSQQYTAIQTAINESSNGDLVLVHPGRYLENLDLSNRNGIILASLEYTTGDTTYVHTTIIDGSNAPTSTILCYENTVNFTIRGFSITGGSGYDFYNGESPYQIFGGGLFIYMTCNISLHNLNIYNNKASSGGGITIFASNTVSMSNVNIFSNISRYRAGGLFIGSDMDYQPNIIFDQVYRCSIYNNFAQWGMDMDWNFINGGSVSVYLKKFTVPQWEKYYADYYDSEYPPSPYTVFDIQESYLQPVDADLYVSPTGNDSNSGLTPTSALKTPSLAMQRIASNPDSPKTVHLLAGEHHNVFAGAYIPIAIKDYTVLQGVSEAQTRLYGENMIEGTGVVTMGIERYGMALRDLSITASNASAIFSWGVHNCTFENITIENSTVDRWTFACGYITSTYSLKNITLRNNIANYYGFGFNFTGSVITMDNVMMQNNRNTGLPEFWYQRGCGGFDIGIADTLTIRNSKFVNNTLYSEDGFANFRVYTDPLQFDPIVHIDNCLFASNHSFNGVRDTQFSSAAKLDIVNCTFANNATTYTDNLLVWADSTNIVNCLFSNNSASYAIRADNTTLIENCLFSRSNNIWHTYSGQPSLHWGDNNLVGADPLFSGTDPTLASHYYLCADDVNGYSPAIDAGTTNPLILPESYQIPTFDAFGFSRIYGNTIDIGCYESQGYTGVEDDELTAIDRLQLSNYPNPFNPTTTIRYTVPKDGDVNICIYNTRGQLVTTLVNERKDKGSYTIVWNGKDNNGSSVSSGIYFTYIVSYGQSKILKMLLCK